MADYYLKDVEVTVVLDPPDPGGDTPFIPTNMVMTMTGYVTDGNNRRAFVVSHDPLTWTSDVEPTHIATLVNAAIEQTFPAPP